MEKYLTSEQVAQVLQVHQFTVLKYLKSGALDGVKIGRMYRIKESDVEKFLGEMTIKHREPRQIKPEVEKVTEAEPTEAEHELKFQDDYYKII